MSNASRLREQSLRMRQYAVAEGEPHLKSRLARHALDLAQLAEKVSRASGAEREEATPAEPLKVPREVALAGA